MICKNSSSSNFREWSQKALEEEQKRKEEEDRRKREEKEKKQQQLQQQQQQHVGTDATAEVTGGALKNPSAPNGDVQAGGDKSTPSQVPHTIVTKSLKKNFASLDCGAKVLSANPEAQSPGNIISSQRDEYMLNKCGDSAWFVVELCESIKALKVELANFELYSSVPHEFRVWLVNSYPAREKDWVLFGNFRADDVRDVQTFHSKEGVFGKYAKVEILSSHGSEHFCPVSMFKIYGISEIELMGGDDDDDDDVVGNLEEVVGVQPTPATPPAPPSGIVSYLKEKMGATLERVVGVFSPRDQSKSEAASTALNDTSLAGNSLKYEVACPDCDVERFRDVYVHVVTSFDHLRKAIENNPSLRSALQNGLCQSHGLKLDVGLGANVTDLENTSTCVAYQTMEFYRTLFGSSGTIALCNVLMAEEGLLPVSTKSQAAGPATTESPKAGSGITGAKTDVANSSVSEIRPIETGGADSSTTGVAKPPLVEHTNKKSKGVEQDSPHNVLVPEGPTSGDKSEQKLKESGQSKGNIDLDVSKRDQEAHGGGDSGSGSADPKAQPAGGVDSSRKSDAVPEVRKPGEAPGPAPSPGKNVEPEQPLKDPPKVVHVPPSTKAHVSTPPQNANGNGASGGGGGPRESVWQKLTNRIKVYITCIAPT